MLEKYRKGESTSTNYPNENKGKISDDQIHALVAYVRELGKK